MKLSPRRTTSSRSIVLGKITLTHRLPRSYRRWTTKFRSLRKILLITRTGQRGLHQVNLQDCILMFFSVKRSAIGAYESGIGAAYLKTSARGIGIYSGGNNCRMGFSAID